ncbi:hypothetical protein A9Q99_14425 [Gammaproteobacteria bacterium 45_16_T64]|nr:hypothetical protein A9Q99_14425 [Gammaproteobacteria bacterium 45_16_T64]
MLKNKINAIRLSALAVAVTGAMGATQAVAEVDVSASVSVSNLYLFRGIDLGNGRAMVSGDLIASMNGFYGGVWATSGDQAAGSEYDLFVGYGMEFDQISLDVSIINYNYPGMDSADQFGDFSEIFLNVGYGPFSFDYQANVADGSYGSADSEKAKAAGVSGFQYYAFNATFKQLTVTLGIADYNDYDEDNPIGGASDIAVGDVGTDYSHLDVSYAYNDNLTFTVSKITDQKQLEVSGDTTKYENRDEDPLVVVSYTLPIE